MFNIDRDITKGHTTFQFKEDREDEDYKLQEVPCPLLRGGCNQDEFLAFTQQWSLYRGYHSGMDEREIRRQLLNSIDGPLEDDMYDVLGSNVNTDIESVALFGCFRGLKQPLFGVFRGLILLRAFWSFKEP